MAIFVIGSVPIIAAADPDVAGVVAVVVEAEPGPGIVPVHTVAEAPPGVVPIKLMDEPGIGIIPVHETEE